MAISISLRSNSAPLTINLAQSAVKVRMLYNHNKEVQEVYNFGVPIVAIYSFGVLIFEQ